MKPPNISSEISFLADIHRIVDELSNRLLQFYKRDQFCRIFCIVLNTLPSGISIHTKSCRATNGNNVAEYKMGSSTVQTSTKALLDRDFITQEDNGAYTIYDKFFSLWLK